MNRLQRFETKKRFQKLTVFSVRAARRIQVLEDLRCAFQINRGQFMGLADVQRLTRKATPDTVHADGLYFIGQGIGCQGAELAHPGRGRPTARQRLSHVHFPVLLCVEFNQRALSGFIQVDAPAIAPRLHPKHLRAQGDVIQTGLWVTVNLCLRVVG